MRRAGDLHPRGSRCVRAQTRTRCVRAQTRTVRASRQINELIADLDQMLGSRELELYSDHEKTHYVHEEKTTREQLEAARSYLVEGRSKFLSINQRLGQGLRRLNTSARPPVC